MVSHSDACKHRHFVSPFDMIPIWVAASEVPILFRPIHLDQLALAVEVHVDAVALKAWPQLVTVHPGPIIPVDDLAATLHPLSVVSRNPCK